MFLLNCIDRIYIFTCYLAITNYNKAFNLIDFKSEIDGVFSPPSWLLPFHQLSPHKLNKGKPFDGGTRDSTSSSILKLVSPPFYIGLLFTRNVAWVNLLPNGSHIGRDQSSFLLRVACVTTLWQYCRGDKPISHNFLLYYV